MMTGQDLIARLGSVPLTAALDEDERNDMALGMRLLTFKPGEALIRQGAKPDGIYVVLSGQVQVTTRLPGGGETLIAERGPGSTLGELALIQSAVRTATVTATQPVEAIYADWRFLSAALAQLRPGAFKVFRQLALMLAARMRFLHERIREAVSGDDRPYELMQLPPAPKEAIEGGAPEGFDVSAFLPVLPCFRDFDPASIQAVQMRAEVISAKRSHHLVARNQAPEHAYVVVRGAVASGFVEAGRLHLVNVRGPGCCCAVSPLIEDRPVSADYVVCESAVLLRIPRAQFLQLFLATDRTALTLMGMVTGHQAAMVSRATNHLKRLVGLSRLFRQLHGNAKVVVT